MTNKEVNKIFLCLNCNKEINFPDSWDHIANVVYSEDNKVIGYKHLTEIDCAKE